MALSLCEEFADSNPRNHKEETLPLNKQPPRISCIRFIDLIKMEFESIMDLPRDLKQTREFEFLQP